MNFLQEKLYPKLPVAFQNVAISAFGFMWNRRRYSGVFKKAYKLYKQREYYTSEQWHEYQTAEMRKLLVHAYTNVPYYRYAFDKAGFNEQKLEQFELTQISELPILEKDALRKYGRKEMLSIVREKGGEFFNSSGSTGTPVSIIYSHSMHQRISALYEARVRNWAGVSKNDARGMIGGRRVIPDGKGHPPYYRYNLVEKQLYFSAYHISPANAINYLKGLLQYPVKYMVGYAQANYILARFFKDQGIKAPRMKAVLTSSEKLTPEMRATLSEVYQCRVFDAWSGMEWCGLISESEKGQLLVSPDSAFIEILRPDGTPAKPGEEGEIICTGFLNYDQPLIRYKIGDVVKIAADQATMCGRAFPVIEEIIGRTEDTVIGKDGRQMVRFHSIFLGLENVIKGQIVQEDFSTFSINIITPGLTTDERATITKRMESQLGKISLSINEVDQIKVGPNGKFKAVISKVPQGL